MDNKLFCPFTRMPCLGRMCACAVYERDSELIRTWWCGMVPDYSYSSVTLSPIDKEVFDREKEDE